MQSLWLHNESHCLPRESSMSQWSGEDTENHTGLFSFQFLKFTCCVTLNRSSSCCFPCIKCRWCFFSPWKNALKSEDTKKCGIYLRNQRWPIVPRKGTVEVGLHFSLSLTSVTIYNRVLRTSFLFVFHILTPFILSLPQTYFWTFWHGSGIAS